MNTKDAREAMTLSEHDFTVRKEPLCLTTGHVIPDKLATLKDSGEYLGTVGKDYTVIQPVDFYDLAQEFINQTAATITRTITLRGSAVIGINFLVDVNEYLPGDPIEMNFLMMTSFDASYSVLGRALSRRIFCMNQLPSSTKLFDVKHTTFAHKRLDIAMKMLGYFGNEKQLFHDKMRLLVKYPMSEFSQISFFKSLFPVPGKDSSKAKTLLDNNTEIFTRLLHSGAGVEVPGVRGTGYHTINALTEYVNHFRGTRVKEGRAEEAVKFESTIFGSGNRLMQAGFNKLIDLIKVDGTYSAK